MLGLLRDVSLLARTCVRRLATAAGLVLLLVACKDDASLVELRLFPCTFDDELPGAVRISIQGQDGAGAAVGDLLEADFSIDEGVFDDDYATVGYRPANGVERALIVVHWYLGDVVAGAGDATVEYDEPVPRPGDTLTLSSAQCPDGGIATGTDGSGTATGNTSAASGTDDSASSDTDASGDTTSMTATTGTGTATGTDPSTSSSVTWDDLEGMSCAMPGDFVCQRTGIHDWAGKLLECTAGTWAQSVDDCPTFCPADFPNEPMPGGCHSQWAGPWSCLCTSAPQVACTPSDEACTANSATLCVDGFLYKAFCPSGCVGGPQGVRCVF